MNDLISESYNDEEMWNPREVPNASVRYLIFIKIIDFINSGLSRVHETIFV